MAKKFVAALMTLMLACISTVATAGSQGWMCSICNDTQFGWKNVYDGNDKHMPICGKCDHHYFSVPCTYIGDNLSPCVEQTCKSCGHTRAPHLFTTYVADANPSCDGKKTATCDFGCGATDTMIDTTIRLGHDCVATVTPPTCAQNGYTTLSCSRCGIIYTVDKTSALGHWYGSWATSGDGTHQARCRRDECSYKKNVECDVRQVILGDAAFSVCLLCGLDAVGGTTALGEKGCVLPRGELSVRGMQAPFGDGLVIYAFTAAYEYDGRVVPFQGTVRFSAPIDAATLDSLTLVRVDAPEAAAWKEIAFTLDTSGQNPGECSLAFETDAGGLFLLIAAQ